MTQKGLESEGADAEFEYTVQHNESKQFCLLNPESSLRKEALVGLDKTTRKAERGRRQANDVRTNPLNKMDFFFKADPFRIPAYGG